jgi:uncharacterized iron-regulated protein
MFALTARVLGAVLGLGIVCAGPTAACTIVKADAYAAFWRGADAPKPRHPLWGQVLFDGQLIRPETQACETSPLQVLTRDLTAAAKDGQIILLGEIHDNDQHHKVRGEIIRQLSAALRVDNDKVRLPLVFEHIRTDQQAGLDQFLSLTANKAQSPTSADFFRLLDWAKSGWPEAEKFKALIDAAIESGATLIAGDPSKTAIRSVARGGLSSLDGDILKTLHLDAPLATPLADALLVDMFDGHCGLMPKEAMAPMANAQRYHDAHLAAVTFEAAADFGTAILLTGNGHVRADRGVPYYLKRMVPDKKSVTVMFVETTDGKIDPNSYAPKTPDGKAAADYIVFTPSVTRKDPCEEMRAMMKKKT